MAKGQTCVSHSTPEAEMVAAATALRQVGLPGQVFFDALLDSYHTFQGHGSMGNRPKGGIVSPRTANGGLVAPIDSSQTTEHATEDP